MADISLLFDVARSGRPSENSETLIKEQLQDIVNNINKTPLEIKVKVEQASLDNMRAEIEGITKSVGALGNGAAFSGIDRGMRAVSSTIGEVNRGLKTVEASAQGVKASLKATNVASLKDALSTIEGLQQSDALKLAESFKSVNAELTSMKARWEESAKGEQRILQLTIGAKNELGQSLQYLVSFDNKTGEISRKLVDVAQSFKSISSESAKTGNTSKNTNNIAENYRSAISVVKEYYKLLTTKDTTPAIANDVMLDNGSWVSKSGAFKKFAQMLDNVYVSYKRVHQEAQAFTAEQKKQLYDVKTKEVQRYNAAVEKTALVSKSASSGTSKSATVTQAYNSSLVSCEKALRSWTAAENSKHESSRAAYQALKTAIDGAKNAKAAYDGRTGSLENYAKAVANMRSTLKTSETTIRANGDATKTLTERLQGLASKFGAWLSVSSIVMAGYRAVRNMISAVVDLDTAMTELKKVTDETDEVYNNFLTNATKRAKALGATLTDTVTATADFARLGYGIEDASALADAAIIYKNVGDGIDDINTASESIIATMQAYGIEASQAMTIVDKFNHVGNNFAITSKGVGDALLRSAAAMKSANNTLDETIALITAANTVVQDPDKVGTALKTVSMYLRAAKTEAEEAGESTEGMASSVSELRNEILSLTGQRVDIQLDANTFKSTYQILKELSTVWGDLSDVTQANILELVGSKRNSNVISAMLENFSVAEAALGASADSTGSALAENEKYLQSIEGKISKLKATFEDLSNSVINSGFIKTIVSFGTTILDILTKIIDGVGALPALIGAVTATMAFKKTGIFKPVEGKPYSLGGAAANSITTFVGNITDIFKNQEGISLGDEFASQLNADKEALIAYRKAIRSGTAPTQALGECMQFASDSALTLAKSGKANVETIAAFIKNQKMSRVSTIAQGTSLGDARRLINEYNSALDEGANGLTKCGLSQKDFTNAVGQSNAVMGNYFANIKKGSKATLGGYMAATAKSIASTIAFSIAITNAMKAIGDIINAVTYLFKDSKKSAIEEFDSIKSELSDATSQLNSLESELSSVESEIDTLLSKGNLSFVEQEELSRLRGVSSELERQIELANTLQENLKKNLGEVALAAYGEYTQDTSFYSKQTKAEREETAKQTGTAMGNAAGLIIGGIIGGLTTGGSGIMFGAAIGSSIGSLGGGLLGGAASNGMYSSEVSVEEMLDRMSSERARLEAMRNSAYDEYSDNPTNNNKKAWEEATQALNDYNSALATHISQLSEYYNTIDYATLSTEQQRQEYLAIGDDLDRYNVMMGAKGSVTNALNRVFSDELITEDMQKLKNAVESALNQASETGDDVFFYDLKLDGCEEAIDRLMSMGITVENVIGYFEQLEVAEAEASNYSTYEMAENISALKIGIEELINAFREFNDEGMLTAETLVKLNAIFGNFGDKWQNYVDIMTNENSSISDAVAATNEMAEVYLGGLFSNGGIKFNKEVIAEDGTKSWVQDSQHYQEQYQTYLSAIAQLEILGVDNAKELIDAMQQQAMIQDVINKKKADAVELEELNNQEHLNFIDLQRKKELEGRTDEYYINEVEQQYGISIQDTALIEQSKQLDEARKKAEETASYINTLKNDGNSFVNQFNESLLLEQEAAQRYDENYEKMQEYLDGLEGWKGVGVVLTDWSYLSNMDNLGEELDGDLATIEEEWQKRQELFTSMLDIAEKTGISLEGTNWESFGQIDAYNDTHIFAQVYDKLVAGLEGAGYDEVVAELEGVVEEGLNGIGMEVDLDLQISEITISNLQDAYGLLDTAVSDMQQNGGLSAATIQAFAEETDDYLDYLYVENGLIKLNTEAWMDYAQARALSNMYVISDKIQTLEEENEILNGKLEDARNNNDTAKIKEYTSKLEENTAKLEENETQLEVLTAIYDDYVKKSELATIATNDFTEAVSGVQKISSGFDQLDKIYADIYNGEDFDWSSIFNNDSFLNTFGSLGDVYLDFVQTIANSPDDINACQEAFNNLTTAYLANSVELAKVTDESRDVAIAILEQKGIANAAAVVDQQLSYNKEYLKYTTGEFAEMEYTEIEALYKSAEAGSLAKEVLARLATEKLQCNANGIKTSSDIEQLMALATSANATSASLRQLAEAKKLMMSADQYNAQAQSSSSFVDRLQHMLMAEQAYREANMILSKPLTYTPFDSDQFKVEYTGGGATSGAQSGSGSSDSKTETWFEKQYKQHKHLVAMEQETDEEYFKWLDSAYKKAYSEGIIELEDYRKYQEEVFKGLRDIFKDHLDDVEHEISMRENYEGESDTIIRLYESLMKEVEKELAAARAQGLDDTSDYVQELQSLWQGYYGNIKDIRENAEDGAKSALDELVDYRIDMIKQEIQDEKDALDTKLDNLKEFYDKQKEMLQDQHDEEKYLEEQSEKRKTVSDLQSELAMLENDDSAWAQKRKLELQEELSEAQDDLASFEDDHALDLALDALDSAYEAEEAQIQAEMDALEEKLNDPEALYNQALTEIKNNTGNLYQEMLEYNRKHGTGNDEDVKDIYEEAYKGFVEYNDVYGEDYKGVVLPNSTDYKPDRGDWDTEKISGTKPESKPQGSNSSQSGSSQSKDTSSKTSPALTVGSTIKVKTSATHFGSYSNGARMASFVPGGSYTVYQTSGNQVLIGKDGVYTGWINKSDIVGYAKGTSNASAGLHSLDEIGSEYLFTSANGNKYRVLSSGDKVLNAKATDFLYKFANGGGEILEKIIKSAFGTSPFDHIRPIVNHNEIDMGDIIVQGSADNRTVSEIRRAQRENLTDMLKSFNKLNK